jgi:hypothetical protein
VPADCTRRRYRRRCHRIGVHASAHGRRIAATPRAIPPLGLNERLTQQVGVTNAVAGATPCALPVYPDCHSGVCGADVTEAGPTEVTPARRRSRHRRSMLRRDGPPRSHPARTPARACDRGPFPLATIVLRRKLPYFILGSKLAGRDGSQGPVAPLRRRLFSTPTDRPCALQQLPLRFPSQSVLISLRLGLPSFGVAGAKE